MSNDNNLVYLENEVRFSESIYWKCQTDYFDDKGINAWIGNVPYYVTCNSLITYSYAQMALRFIQDGIRNGLIDPKETIYLTELGTGSGRFSYQFLTFFTQFVKDFNCDFKFCYVMTDSTQSNLDYWEQHDQFQPFIEQGILDFAIYWIGQDKPIELKLSNITLSENTLKNPMIAIANYIFDSIPPDAFRVENGKLHEGLISVMTDKHNLGPNNKIIELNGLKSRFDFKPINPEYYDDPYINQILAFYEENLETSTFLIPYTSIQCINHLSSIAGGKLAVISADKGYTHYTSLKNLATPHIAFHGSLSVMVNFDCIGQYIKHRGGDVLMATETEGMKVNMFGVGFKFDDMPETRWAYQQFGHRFSTKEFLLIKNEVIEHASDLTLQEFMSLLKMSYWDPDILVSVAMEWGQKLGEASPGYLDELRAGLLELYDNYYFIPNYKNPLFEMGHIYHVIGDLDMALERYNESMRRFGEDAATVMSIGFCHYYKEDKATALKCFEKALELDPNNESAKEWISFVQE